MTQQPPLTGIRVLEFAGLAPGPFAGMLLADYGATVLRLDRAPVIPTNDQLTRHKTSICVNLKSPGGIALIKKLILHVDVVIDPFRPGVLEKLGLGPEEVLLKLNPRLVVGRMTGFRRDGKYSQMAGHDINYIAVSGVLSMFGRKGEKPYPPGNVVGDFAGGGAMCFLGILLALFARAHNGGIGQVVEANMVDGSAILATMPRLGLKTEMWRAPRGENMLDGGAPFYDTYETKDGRFMAVGAIEPQFFAQLLKGLSLTPSSLPGAQQDRKCWPAMKTLFTSTFKSKNRDEWEKIFGDTDACCTPVITQAELEADGFDQRPAVTLKASPGYAIAEGSADRPAAVGQGSGVKGSGWNNELLQPGKGGEETLEQWLGWKRGKQFGVEGGGLVINGTSKL
ncbi:CoA-transferase family III [Mytilinidion resinicola]|uniref:CoA-transferase family III n=1 Tax=Mytilinidion resinicola TaxID=574789 RepID=A0A6A6XYG2_9PEZI|nr:CoA-transferase family III [Mytilinidion resinicola]KAF2801542.1 CoA-transferase family III [Mytilinidion resinicola]